MSAQMELKEATLSGLRRVYSAPGISAHATDFAVLTLSIVNRSRSRTYYLLSSVTRLHYDAADATLVVDMTLPDLVEAGEPQHLFCPSIQIMQPKALFVLRTPLPMVLRLVSEPLTVGFGYRTADLVGAKRVRCSMFYGLIWETDTPLRQRITLLRDWGIVAEASSPIKSADQLT